MQYLLRRFYIFLNIFLISFTQRSAIYYITVVITVIITVITVINYYSSRCKNSASHNYCAKEIHLVFCVRLRCYFEIACIYHITKYELYNIFIKVLYLDYRRTESARYVHILSIRGLTVTYFTFDNHHCGK